MSNGWKAGRVAQVFSVQLRDRIITEQSHFCFLLTAIRFQIVFILYFSKVITMGLEMFSWLFFR
jgi:hypothetical protein